MFDVNLSGCLVISIDLKYEMNLRRRELKREDAFEFFSRARTF